MSYETPICERYVIYARRSSDDGSGKQLKSVPDQIQFCLELAEKEGIEINKESDIFTESASAKKANQRAVFTKLLKLIRQGDVDGIICWHPDRLSRNMLEAGEIIDLLDDGSIKDLKFCTHHFENTASGKMMLGILFSISKEYSDSLSERINRGVQTNLEQGKSAGTPKWGYNRIEDGYYVPSKNFSFIRKAWEMRLNGKTYEEIVRWLKRVDCFRMTKESKRKIVIDRSSLTRLFKDPIYYGVLVQTGKPVDLREIDQEFEPMISEEEFRRVQTLARRKNKRNTKQNYPFRDGIIKHVSGEVCFPEASKSSNGKNYLYITCRKNLKKADRMRARVFLAEVSKFLKENFKKPNPKDYKKYLEVMNEAIQEDMNDRTKQRKALMNQKIKQQQELEDLIMSMFKREQRGNVSESEISTYEKEKFKLEESLKALDSDIKKIEKNTLLEAFSYEEFSNFLKDAVGYWEKADSEQKHELVKFLFSNIVVGHGKVHKLEPKRLIAKLFVGFGGGGENRTRVQRGNIPSSTEPSSAVYLL